MKKIFLIGLLPACMLGAQVCHVVPPGTTGAAPSPPFASWTDAATNIQEAVQAAYLNGWTNLLISNGTYLLTNQVAITNALYVRSWKDGATDRAGTVIDGGYVAGEPLTNRCFYVDHSNAVLDGITMTNGYAAGVGGTTGQAGGGVWLRYGMLTNCAILNCTAQYMGGGVMMTSGSVYNCLVAGNRALLSAGGVRMVGGVMDSCEIFSNISVAEVGGVSMNYDGLVTNTAIRFNLASGYAGGIFVLDSGILTHSDISMNSNNNSGAGIYVSGAAITVAHCTVSCNTSSFSGSSSTVGGGGIHIYNGSRVAHCRIYSNFINVAGGAYIREGGTLSDCDIFGNIGHGTGNNRGGGGVYVNMRGLVENCRITDNVSTNGAGIILWASQDIILRGSLIAGNSSTGTHGAIYVYNGTNTTIQNCTVASNYARGNGGGLYLSPPVTSVVENCIIYHNTGAPTYSNYYIGTPGTSAFYNTCTAPSVDVRGPGNTTAEPRFLDLPGGNYRLASDSPCVNAGTNQEWMAAAMDLDGHARLDRFIRRVDMGCYEYYSSGSLILLR